MAQSVNGVVTGNDSIAIPLATVSLLQASDSAYITGCIGKDDGTFSFDASPGKKLVKVSCVGYKTAILPAGDKMRVTLQASEQSLKEVTVTAVRPTFKMTKGVFVSNIQGTVFSKLGKAADVLQQLPMMSADGKSVLGRGEPIIFINNKRMRNRSELERITSDMIKDVRIDMNPGAKYGSDVRAVLFITTIRPVGEGLGGTLTMMERVSSCWTTSGELDLNYRRKGVDVFLSSWYNGFSNFKYNRKDAYDFKYKGQGVNAEYDGEGSQSIKNGFITVGFNDQLSDVQSLGATYTFSRMFSGNYGQDYRNRVENDGVLTWYDTSSREFAQNGKHDVSVYYENKFSDKLSLNVDGTYVHNDANSSQTITDTHAGSNAMILPVSDTKSDMGALKTVLTSPVAGGSLEYGFETTYTRFRQKYEVGGNDKGGVLRANDNESRQSAANLFATYSRSFGTLYAQLGLKYEYSDYDYYAGGKMIEGSSRTYNRILPSVSLSQTFGRLSMMLSYNVYTNSPTYDQLDEALRYMSDFRYNRGNSMLKPTYQHEVSLTTSCKDFQLYCYYSYKKDAIITSFDVMEQIPAVVASETNNSYSSLYTMVSYAPTLFNIWKPSWYVFMYKQWMEYRGLNYNHPQFGMLWKNVLSLPKNWIVTVNATGTLKGNGDTYMSQPSLKVDLSVQKNMKNWWVKLGGTDLFNAKEKGYSRYDNVYTSHEVDYRDPVVSLTVSYSFNPAKSKYKGQKAGQSELNRL